LSTSPGLNNVSLGALRQAGIDQSVLCGLVSRGSCPVLWRKARPRQRKSPSQAKLPSGFGQIPQIDTGNVPQRLKLLKVISSVMCSSDAWCAAVHVSRGELVSLIYRSTLNHELQPSRAWSSRRPLASTNTDAADVNQALNPARHPGHTLRPTRSGTATSPFENSRPSDTRCAMVPKCPPLPMLNHIKSRVRRTQATARLIEVTRPPIE